MRRVRYLLWLLLVLVLAAAAGGWYWLHSGNPDALRQIVLQQCVPNQQQHQTPSPCADVLFSQKEWEENHYTLFNHNVNKEGIAI